MGPTNNELSVNVKYSTCYDKCIESSFLICITVIIFLRVLSQQRISRCMIISHRIAKICFRFLTIKMTQFIWKKIHEYQLSTSTIQFQIIYQQLDILSQSKPQEHRHAWDMADQHVANSTRRRTRAGKKYHGPQYRLYDISVRVSQNMRSS